MRLIIDMQGCQAENAKRGIGRYTISLVKEMILQSDQNSVFLLLNNAFPDSVEYLQETFFQFLPTENILTYNSLAYSGTYSNNDRHIIMEVILETYIAKLNPDVILVTSLFEGYNNSAVSSIKKFINDIPVAAILYDLIPLIYQDHYLKDPQYKHWYSNKLEQLKQADLLLAISNSTAQEAMTYLDIPPAKLVNISSACDEQFKSFETTIEQQSYLKETFSIARPFLLYTGGLDYRKNIDGLISAYAALPQRLRNSHQLVIVCAIGSREQQSYQKLGKEKNLAQDELVFTGFVSENDLVLLYNACKLFVFPSWHEGFGLPILEAMSCGKAVIGADTSSIPEVIGCKDMLFTAFSNDAITEKIIQVLDDSDCIKRYETHGLLQSQKFSWQQSAERAWQAINRIDIKSNICRPLLNTDGSKPRLAFVAPLPPLKSGISEYSADLLAELHQYYDIDVITVQAGLDAVIVNENFNVKSVDWFRRHNLNYDRVLYQIGNSDFHSHMFQLIADIPGVIVLHDFYLSGVIVNMESQSEVHHGKWAKSLLYSHGWLAVQQRYFRENFVDVVYEYPCNLEVLHSALGVIVHSEFSKRLAEKFYGIGAAADWQVIPLLKKPSINSSKQAARERLGINKDKFIIASFGILGPTKLNHRLLSAWLSSPLSADPDCHLVFVGQNDDAQYSKELISQIELSGVKERIIITGWADSENYQDWLSIADIGVQIRSLTRGESSGAVLDCMNNGIATIINANGAMADIIDDAVVILPDDFTDGQLSESLVKLYRDSNYRRKLGEKAANYLHTVHHPTECVKRYVEVIEKYYSKAERDLQGVMNALVEKGLCSSDEDIIEVSQVLSINFPSKPQRKQLLLDISDLVYGLLSDELRKDALALLKLFLYMPPEEYIVQPIYKDRDKAEFRYACRYMCQLLGVESSWIDDYVATIQPGDSLLCLMSSIEPKINRNGLLLDLYRRGVSIHSILYYPQTFLIERFGYPEFEQWIELITRFNSIVCINQDKESEIISWLAENYSQRLSQVDINWFQLTFGIVGIDFRNDKLALDESINDSYRRLLETLLKSK
jgi:glycosyltransferase involved in cell wall biosynthesis